MIIRLKVFEQTLSIVETKSVPRKGSKDYLALQFTFSSLASITIPDGVTVIGDYAFGNCYGMRYYDFSACTSIPALSNTNTFIDIPSDCQMIISSALYDNWKSATNWSTYASYMVAV